METSFWSRIISLLAPKALATRVRIRNRHIQSFLAKVSYLTFPEIWLWWAAESRRIRKVWLFLEKWLYPKQNSLEGLEKAHSLRKRVPVS
jgi:hypothetical protein